MFVVDGGMWHVAKEDRPCRYTLAPLNEASPVPYQVLNEELRIDDSSSKSIVLAAWRPWLFYLCRGLQKCKDFRGKVYRGCFACKKPHEPPSKHCSNCGIVAISAISHKRPHEPPSKHCTSCGIVAISAIAAIAELCGIQGPVRLFARFPATTFDVPTQYWPGRQVRFRAFTSTSKAMDVAAYHTHSEGTILEMSVTRGKELGALSAFPNEDEVVLLPNTRLVCTDDPSPVRTYDDDDDVLLVRLLEVSQSELVG